VQVVTRYRIERLIGSVGSTGSQSLPDQ